MPVNYGFPEIHLGTGDVSVAAHTTRDGVEALVFRELPFAAPPGTDLMPLKLRLCPPVAVVTFTAPESIDAVIAALQHIRENLCSKQSSPPASSESPTESPGTSNTPH